MATPHRANGVRSAQRGASARSRVGIAAAIGAVAGVVEGIAGSGTAAPLVGWVLAAGVFVTWTWCTVWRQDAVETAADARREDPSRPVADIACTLAAVASLAAVAVILFAAGNAARTPKLLEIGLAVVAIATSWLLVHTVFLLRYARLYYGGRGGIDFNSGDDPCYSDFAYLALTIGMTFQVSDTDLETKSFRRLALRHMLLSYLLGAIFVAVTINLVAGLVNG